MLAAVKGTLVPMQFWFLEDDLEKLQKSKKLTDVRSLPDSVVNPIVTVHKP